MNKKKVIITIISIVLALTLCLTAAGAVGVVAIGALATGAVVVGGGIIAAVIYNQPEYVAGRALLNFGDDLLARNELKPIVQALNGGSVEFNVDNITTDADGKYSETFDMSVKGKFYFGEDEMMLKDFVLRQEDVLLNGDMYISDDELYIKETEVLQDAYGVKFSELANDLSGSIFAPYSGTEYALDEDTYQTLVNISRIASRSDEMKEDVKELSDTLTKDIWKIVVEHAEVTSENADVELNGTYKNSRVISIRIDRRAMELIINNVYYYLRDSQDIYDFLYEYEDSLAPVFEEYYYEEGYSSLSEAYRNEMWKAEDEVRSFSKELYSSYNDFYSVELRLTTPTFLFSTLRKLELFVNDRQVLVLDCGAKGIKKSDTVSLRIPDAIEATYRITENNEHWTKATLDISNYSNFSIKFFANINKYEGTYTAGFEYPETSYIEVPEEEITTDTNDWYDDEYGNENEFESGADIWEDYPDDEIEIEIPIETEIEYPDYNFDNPDDVTTSESSINVEIPPYVEVKTQATDDTPYYGEAVYDDDYGYDDNYSYDYDDGYVYDEIIRDEYYPLIEYASYIRFTVEGQLITLSDTETYITVDRIVYENDRDYVSTPDDHYYEAYVITLYSQFILDTKDKMPEKINYKTINQIAVADIENLLLRIENLY